MEKIRNNDKLLFITSCFPPYVGASERRNSNFVYAIKQFTDNIHVLSYHIHSLKTKIPNFQEDKIKNLGIIRFEIRNKWIGKLLLFKRFVNPLYIWLCFFSALIFMLIKNPKYVFISVPSFPLGFSVALACKIIKKRLILNLQDIPGRIKRNGLRLFQGSLIVILTASVAKLILTLNNLIKKEISFFKNTSLVKIIPTGINGEIIRKAKKPPRSPTVVFVGGASLEWYYEPEFLIKTASFLKDMENDIKIKIIGASKSLKKNLSRLIEKQNLTEYVTVCSPVPIEELYDILLKSSVGIMEFGKKFKSFYEYAALVTLPAKVVEYLACGLSVAYRGPDGPLASFITKHSVGAIVDTDSPKAFASCIKAALQLRQRNPTYFNDFSNTFLQNHDEITLFTRFLSNMFSKDERI